MHIQTYAYITSHVHTQHACACAHPNHGSKHIDVSVTACCDCTDILFIQGSYLNGRCVHTRVIIIHKCDAHSCLYIRCVHTRAILIHRLCSYKSRAHTYFISTNTRYTHENLTFIRMYRFTHHIHIVSMPDIHVHTCVSPLTNCAYVSHVYIYTRYVDKMACPYTRSVMTQR